MTAFLHLPEEKCARVVDIPIILLIFARPNPDTLIIYTYIVIMATPEFKYAPMFQMGKDDTEYYLLTKDGVSVSEFEGKPILKVSPEALTRLANAAFRDVNFLLRRSHNEQVAQILTDPEASDNDKYVALTFLRNAEVACKGKLPFCQDTGTAIIHGEKGQQVWTGFCDEEALSLGVYKTYTEENLRYSQNAPLTMYDEVNTRCNLPAQIDIEATEGDEYKFLCVVKGGGSANKTYFYQETKARIQNPGTLVPFLVEKMKTLGTAACPPYHIAFVIGGTSAEKNLLTVKLASTHYYDNLPTTGDETGRAFRDIALEKELLAEAHRIGLGAQFGGKYFAHDIRVIRLPRHGASCPIGLGVSCSADRNIKAKINKDGIWIEKLDDNPGELIPEELRNAGEGNAVRIDLNQPMSEICKILSQYPVARQAESPPGCRRGLAAVLQGPSRALRRPGQDARRNALRLHGPDDGQPHGPLRGRVPGPRRLHGDDCQGQPHAGGDRRVQEAWRLLPGQHRRPGCRALHEQHQEHRVRGVSRAGHGGHLENPGGGFPRLHPGG